MKRILMKIENALIRYVKRHRIEVEERMSRPKWRYLEGVVTKIDGDCERLRCWNFVEHDDNLLSYNNRWFIFEILEKHEVQG